MSCATTAAGRWLILEAHQTFDASRRDTGVTERRNGGGTCALRQFLPRGIENEAMVVIKRLGQAEQHLQQALGAGRGEQVMPRVTCVMPWRASSTTTAMR